jgi:hypothetical protein
MPIKQKRKRQEAEDTGSGNPRYPYTVAPKSLRRFLELVPQKPKPPKITTSTLRTWGFKSGNDLSILRVLKEIELLSPAGEPTQHYGDFMKTGTGAAALGRQIKKSYEALFQNVSNPEKSSNDELRNFFNINSGGSERTIQLQIDTFKALVAYATFGDNDPLAQDSLEHSANDSGSPVGTPAIRIDLHIHLPENKSKSDYDAILESIANHLYKSRK